MASQLTRGRIEQWRALKTFDQKKAYLRTALPKNSAVQDMLKNRGQAERVIAWLDHFIDSGAAETASEGAGAVLGESLGVAATATRPTNMKALLRANPNTAAIAASLLQTMPVTYNPAWSTDTKLKCLRSAASPGSVADQLLQSDAHAKTLVDFIDNTGLVAKTNPGLARKNSEFKDIFTELGVMEEAEVYVRPTTQGKAFLHSNSAYNTSCPYTNKAIPKGTRVAKPRILSGVQYANAPWGHASIQQMPDVELEAILAKLGVKRQDALAETLKPPSVEGVEKTPKVKPERQKKPTRLRAALPDDTPVRDNPDSLPPGYSIQERPSSTAAGKSEHHVLHNGKEIGRYAMTPDKAVYFALQHASGYVNPFSKEGRARAKAAGK
jgi:hypothetical protein